MNICICTVSKKEMLSSFCHYCHLCRCVEKCLQCAEVNHFSIIIIIVTSLPFVQMCGRTLAMSCSKSLNNIIIIIVTSSPFVQMCGRTLAMSCSGC